MANKDDLMDKITNLAKRRGFIYASSEIYGGLANAWDYGPLGAQLKKNIKDLWWNFFVEQREDMVGLDSSIILNKKVWEASGHVAGFSDALIDCKKCKARFRADHLIEEQSGVDVEGKTPEEIEAVIKEKRIACPLCKSIEFTPPREFNLLFPVYLGAVKDDKSLAYLRGETAQGIFVDFKQILDTTRKKIPFGVGQIGKAFRNEVTTGNFVYRTREFEQMEIEYFFNPNRNWEEIFEEWLKRMHLFANMVGIKKEMLIEREIPKDKLAHYSKRTIDIEYKFPFGHKELWGLAYRTDHDLKNHQEYSGEDMSYTDPEGGKYLPHVIEPTFGVERTLLAVLLSAYDEEKIKDETRTVLKFDKRLAPIKVAILPLSKKEELSKKAKEVLDLLKEHFVCEFDETQSIGKRYRRQDEIGTPLCVTIDFETLNDEAVTVRDRDTMKQERISIKDILDFTKNYYSTL